MKEFPWQALQPQSRLKVRVIVVVAACLLGLWMPSRMHAQNDVASGTSDDQSRTVKALLARPISLTLDRVSLKMAIDSIARVADVVVQYRTPLLARYTAPVSVHAHATPLAIVLEHVLEGTNLRITASRQGGILLAQALAPMAAADSILGSINGRVIDSATSRGVPSATVKVAGTKISAVTNDSGRFQLRGVPAGERTVSVRTFGYRPDERSVTVDAASPVAVRIVLASVPNVLSGVVTTATGVQERRSIGNDITVLNADSVMRTAPVRNITDLLATRVPGLTVQRTSGTPGAPARIRLRGAGSYIVPGSTTMSNDPIVIVDGVRVYAGQSTPRDRNLATRDALGQFPPTSALDQIDPNSIETIEVFKGPSATSQWGADAGNGVIVITTKRGTVGPTHVDMTLQQGIERMPGVYAPPGSYVWGHTNLVEGASVLCSPIRSNTTNFCLSTDSVVHFQAVGSPRLSPFATGTEQDGSVTVRGGNGSVTYALTGSAGNTLGYLTMPDLYQDIYRDAYGEVPPKWMRRPDQFTTWSGGASLTAVPMPGLSVTLGTSLSNADQRQSSGNDALSQLAVTYIDTVAAQLAVPTGFGASSYYTRSATLRTTSTTNLQANWTRWRSLQTTGAIGVSTGDRTDQISIPYGLPHVDPFVQAGTDTLGDFFKGRGSERTRTADVSATFLPAGLVRTAVGMNVVTTSTDDIRGRQDTLTAGVSVPGKLKDVTQTGYSLTTAGWYVEPRLNLQSRFFIAPGMRFDGGNARSGSGFGSGQLKNGIFAFFPKLNFSWIAVDRTGNRPLGGFLTTLRPRLAIGVAGEQPDPGQNLRLYSPQQCNGNICFVGAGLFPGVVVNSVGNSKLHPERAHEREGGFDADLWNSRLQLTVTAYNNLRTDVIMPIELPASLGQYQFYINAGKVRNSGEEVTMTAQLFDQRSFRFAVHATYSANRNRVIALTDTLAQRILGSVNATNPIVPGYPTDGRWARPILGYADQNGDSHIDASEIAVGDSAVFLGASFPKYELAFGSDFSFWHGLVAINTQFSYKRGLNQFNTGSFPRLVSLLLDTTTSLAQQAAILAAVQCGTGSGPTTANGLTTFVNQAATLTACSGTDRSNDLYGASATAYGLFQSVNVLRFESISVSYQVPETWTRRVRLPHATVALQGSNLKLWTNYRGKDPDVTGDLGSELNSDNGELPQPRRWMLSLRLGN